MNICHCTLMHRLNEQWYKQVRRGAPHTREKKVVQAESRRFIKWVQARPNPWYPVNVAMSQKLCRASAHRAVASSFAPYTPPEPSKRTRPVEVTTAPPPSPCTARPNKRTRRHVQFVPSVQPSHTPSADAPEVQCPSSATVEVECISDAEYVSSAASCSSSEDGQVEDDWIKEAEEQWRRRPEPHRSNALRELAHTLKVRDGSTLEYATLFAYASYQRQTQYGEAIKNLVAARCVQQKISKVQYERDLVPFYKVRLHDPNPQFPL